MTDEQADHELLATSAKGENQLHTELDGDSDVFNKRVNECVSFGEKQ